MEALAQAAGLDLYRAAFEKLEEERRDEPRWLRRLRAEALERFLDLGFPTTRIEAWKYTNLRPIAETPWMITRPASSSAAAADLAAPARIPGATEIVFFNGSFAPELSSLGEPEEGVRVASLREALTRRPEDLEPVFGKVNPIGQSPLTALNTALFQDGVCVSIAPGASASRPVHCLFIQQHQEPFALTAPRLLVLAGRQSQAALVETYVGRGEAPGWTNSVTEISIGESAILEHYKVQEESLSGYHVQSISARQGRASGFTSHNVATGSALARTDIDVLFDGEGGDCSLNGLFVGSGSQHLDNHTFIDHAHPHCTSRELYKGILDDQARGVFHGTIRVRPGAQKTDAMQTNKNLLLSRRALVDSTPALEILADDVKCKHGSTIGQLDANALFYLRSRGLGEAEARTLLIYAFAADVAERLRIGPVRERVEAFLGRALVGGSPLAPEQENP
jgi:Fe-S cluster assembly protein SufD